MAEEGTFTIRAEVLRKAGRGASATPSAEEYTNDFIKQAESYINVLTRYNFTDNYAATNADVKLILKEAASNLAAIYVIQYDISGYTSSREAENIINMNWARFTQCIQLLNDQKTITYIRGA